MLMCINTEGVQPMAWCSRMQIAMDIARGISFLHSLNANIIYRDLKASNILIDSVCCNLLLHASLTPLCPKKRLIGYGLFICFRGFMPSFRTLGSPEGVPSVTAPTSPLESSAPWAMLPPNTSLQVSFYYSCLNLISDFLKEEFELN